jgi:hypothetical protein
MKNSQGQPTVVELDKAGLKRAVDATLRSSGYTYKQLESQARSGSFESPRARVVWGAVKGLK